MKKLVDLCPVFMKRLWARLAVGYTLLTFCAMTLLIVTFYGIDDYQDFYTAITPQAIEKQLLSENLILSQAIENPENTQWVEKARNSIYEKLTIIDNTPITNSSLPEIYIQLFDINNNVVMSNPMIFPQKISNNFDIQKQHPPEKDIVKWLDDNKSIWINLTIVNDHNQKVGYLRVLYIAEFNIWIQIQSSLKFLLFVWSSILICSIPIGIACGLLAARYVTKQLQRMNEVTERWRQGYFDVRIALPHDDVLIRHSKYLNDMAQDLKMYLLLKQNLAVNDERNRVARELHDTVKQKLFALGLQLATTKTKPVVMEVAREHILEAEMITREAQHDLMEIITQLRPPEKENTSLSERICIIAEDFKRRFGVCIRITFSDSVQPNSYSDHHIFRIVQEALMNAVRHGKASEIMINSKTNQGLIKLSIADNGVGFNTDQKTEGFGITSMRDRMQNLNGTFQMKSTVGMGTQIILSWRNDT